MKTFAASCFAVFASGLSGCSGGGGGAESAAGQAEAVVSPLRGYYTGTITPDGSSLNSGSVVGMVTDAGVGYFWDKENGRQLVVDFDPGPVSGAVREYLKTTTTVNITDNTSAHPGGDSWPQTTFQAGGTLTGDVNEARDLETSYAFGDETGTLSLQYDGTTFQRSSDFGLLTGDWTIQPTTASNYGITLTFRTDGSFQGTDSKGCAFSGNATIPDTTVNEYVLAATVNCGSGSYTASGMAARVHVDTTTVGPVSTTVENLAIALANDTHSFFKDGLQRKTP